MACCFFVTTLRLLVNMEDFLNKFIQAIRTFFKEKLHYKAEDLPYYLTILIAMVLFVVGLNAFVELTEELVQNELASFDSKISSVVLSFRRDSITAFMIFITNVGTRTGYFIVVVLLAAYFFLPHRSWKFIVQTVAVLILASLSTRRNHLTRQQTKQRR